MKALVLKLLTEGLSPAEVASKLREMADEIETAGLEDRDYEREVDGMLVGTLRLSARKPAMRAMDAPPPAQKPKAERRCDVRRAVRLAEELEAELNRGADGVTGIVIGDIAAETTLIRRKLDRLGRCLQ